MKFGRCETEFCNKKGVQKIYSTRQQKEMVVCVDCLSEQKIYAMFDWLLLREKDEKETSGRG